MSRSIKPPTVTDVLAWCRGMGRGYQWEINKMLRQAMEEELRAGSREL